MVPSGAIAGWDIDATGVFHGFVRAKGRGIKTFDAPGAGKGRGYGTVAYGINPSGAITGEYDDPGNVFHGFLRATDGRIKTFVAPGAGTGYGQGTFANSINPAGTIAGYYSDAATCITGSCDALAMEPSPRSTLRARAQAPVKAPSLTTSQASPRRGQSRDLI